jgi:hypothetical protein
MKFLDLALIGGGAFLAYETGLLSMLTGGLIPAPGSTTTTTTTPPAPGAPTSPPVNPVTPPPGTTTVLDQVAAKAGGASQLLSFDQWNYAYQAVRGVPGPAPDQFLSAADRFKLISINEWWGYMQQAGLSGIGILAPRRGALGMFRPLTLFPPTNKLNPTPENTGERLPPGGIGMGYAGMGYAGLGYAGMGYRGRWIY